MWHRKKKKRKKNNTKQAGAELCQAQFKLGLAKTALMMLMLFFAFPVLKI
jgi:hypothetical protein